MPRPAPQSATAPTWLDVIGSSQESSLSLGTRITRLAELAASVHCHAATEAYSSSPSLSGRHGGRPPALVIPADAFAPAGDAAKECG